MKLSGSNIKKFLTFSQNKAFLTFEETETLRNFIVFQQTNGNFKKLIFQEVTFHAQKMKKTHSYNVSYVWRNGTF